MEDMEVLDYLASQPASGGLPMSMFGKKASGTGVQEGSREQAAKC